MFRQSCHQPSILTQTEALEREEEEAWRTEQIRGKLARPFRHVRVGWLMLTPNIYLVKGTTYN